MSTRDRAERDRLLQGTLDLLILRTLVLGRHHGQGIAHAIQQTSSEALLVDHGSLYPALQRLEERGWIRAEWGVSANNRRHVDTSAPSEGPLSGQFRPANGTHRVAAYRTLASYADVDMNGRCWPISDRRP